MLAMPSQAVEPLQAFPLSMMSSHVTNGFAISPSPAAQSYLLPEQQQLILQPPLQLTHICTSSSLNTAPTPMGSVGQVGLGHLPSTVFFAGVTPIADVHKLRTLFSQFGRVVDLNLFRPYNGCRTSKGCGLVVYAQHSEAAAALETLNGRYVWPGARSPMAIEWCDQNKQHKKRRAQPLGATMVHYPVFLQQVPQAPYVQHHAVQPLLPQVLQHHAPNLVQMPVSVSTQHMGLQLL